MSRKREKALLLKGEYEGIWESWYKKWTEKKYRTIYKRKKMLLWTSWHENGNIHIRLTYKLDRENDSCKVYSEDGELILERRYDEGEILSGWKEYEMGEELIANQYFNIGEDSLKSGDYRDGLTLLHKGNRS